jgi:hypothetical protein
MIIDPTWFFLLENTIHYDQFCQFEHAWVYVRWASHFFISIMHAHPRKNMSYVYAQWASVCQKQSYGLAHRASTMIFFVNTLPVGYS